MRVQWLAAFAVLFAPACAQQSLGVVTTGPTSPCGLAQTGSEAACCNMYLRYQKAVVGGTWGDMPKAKQHLWAQLNCDSFAEHLRKDRAQEKQIDGLIKGMCWKASKTVKLHSARKKLANCCVLYFHHPSVKIGKSYGDLNWGEKIQWIANNCDGFQAKLKQLVRQQAQAAAHMGDALGTSKTFTPAPTPFALTNSPCDVAPSQVARKCCIRYLEHPTAVIAKTWGDMGINLRNEWNKLACNDYASVLNAARAQKKREVAESNAICTGLARNPHPGHIQFCCNQYLSHPRMVIGKSWGDLPRKVRDWWNYDYACDAHQKELIQARASLTQWKSRQWREWSPGDSKQAPEKQQCPTQLHAMCGKSKSLGSCMRCASKAEKLQKVSSTYCDFKFVCSLIAASNGPKKTEEVKFIEQGLMPKGVMRSAFVKSAAGAGACLLSHAEGVLNMFRSMATCETFYPFPGTTCHTHEPAQIASSLAECCTKERNKHVAGLCKHYARPAAVIMKKHVAKSYNACTKNSASCSQVRKSYSTCMQSGEPHFCLHAFIHGKKGGPTFKVYSKLVEGAHKLWMQHSKHKYGLPSHAKHLINFCSIKDKKSKDICAKNLFNFARTEDDRILLHPEDFAKFA